MRADTRVCIFLEMIGGGGSSRIISRQFRGRIHSDDQFGNVISTPMSTVQLSDRCQRLAQPLVSIFHMIFQTHVTLTGAIITPSDFTRL